MDVSLLLASGHSHARRYPVSMVWAEAEIARRRQSQDLATHMTLLHSAVAAVIAGPGEFKKQVEGLVNG